MHALTVLETHFRSTQNAPNAVDALPTQLHDAPSSQPERVQPQQCPNGKALRSAPSVLASKIVVTPDGGATVPMSVTLPPATCTGVRPQTAKMFTHDDVHAKPLPTAAPKCDVAQPPSQEANGVLS
ncbi:hypothetical protein FGB62_22g99 [Gracilaria domingensis]|nr:hypothetical protein FGB62_22g99 [Gracilaria domingensis]